MPLLDEKRLAELKSALNAQLDIIEEGVKNPDIVKIEQKDGQTFMTIEQSSMDKIMTAKKNVEEIKTLITAEAFGMDMKQWMDSPSFGSAAVAAAANGQNPFTPQQAQQIKDLGGAFLDSDEFKTLQKSGGYTMQTPWELDTFDVSAQGWGRKDIYTTMGSHNIAAGVGTVVQFDPMVPRGQRVNRVRDLFPVARTSANLIDYFRVSGFVENAGKGSAAPVRERAAADGVSAPTGGATDTFGLKPKSNLQFTPAQAPVRTIAHWEAAHRNVLQDEPQLQATINNELLYGLALEEDYQILQGDGTNENLQGILATPGIQQYTQQNDGAATPVPTERKSDALRRAATLGVLAYFPPTGYVLHPNDWEDVELQKGTGDGQYMLVTNVAIGMSAQIWRLPVVETPAMPEGTFLTGAFGTGAQLYDRARASVRIAEQHADFFVRNAIAILVEERLALAVKRPESFVRGTFIDAAGE
jgi:HK97 family phage major capsid protein